MCSKREQMLPAQVLWQSTEHPGSPVREWHINQRSAWRAVDCVSKSGSFVSQSEEGTGDMGKAGEGAAEPPTAALRGGLMGLNCVLCPLPANGVSHLRAALPEDGPWC